MVIEPVGERGWRGLLPLLLVGAIGCAGSSEGGTSVRLVSAGAGLSAGQVLSTRDAGWLRVDALYWTTSEVELLPCRSAWQRAARWLVPEAHAHGLATPTLLATPTVESAAATDDVLLGELRPPAGEYCGLRYRMAPADADAVDLGAAPEMLGNSVLLRGALGSAAAELEAFELSSGFGVEVELPLSLELTRERPEATIRFEHDPASGFEGLDLMGLAPGERDGTLLDAFAASLRIELE